MNVDGQAAGGSPIVLPELKWVPTRAKGSRHGAHVRLVVVHRWGVRYIDAVHEACSYEGVVDYFQRPSHGASAHLVYPGSSVAGGSEATQMVPWSEKAWAQGGYNAQADEIESADAIWLGHDWHGFHVLARMVAKRLRARGLPARWLHGSALLSGQGGFCRHADLGELGGGHPACPTTDLRLWAVFCQAVQLEYHRGGFRPVWGR
jgi:hypothetical protein